MVTTNRLKKEEIKRTFFQQISRLIDHWEDEEWINKEFKKLKKRK